MTANEERHPKWVTAIAVIVAVLLAVLAIIQTLLLLKIGWHFNFGSLPDWLAGIGTVGALWVAGLVWRHDVRERRIAESANLERDMRAQANKISGWLIRERSNKVQIGLINGSDGLVFDVQVQTVLRSLVPITEGSDGPWYRGPAARGQVSVVPPGRWVTALDFEVPDGPELVSIEIWFRDQRGNTWFRDARGRLFAKNGRLFALMDTFNMSESDLVGIREQETAELTDASAQMLKLLPWNERAVS